MAASLVEKEQRLKAVSPPSTLAGRLKRKAGVALHRHTSDAIDPEPLKAPAASSSSKQKVSLEDELQELRASYGLTSQPSKTVMAVSCMEIQSSQEEVASQPAASADFIQYMTPTGMIRLHKDGSKEVGTLVPGKSGFAVAVFGKETVETEVPNLLVTLPVMKKPAGVLQPPVHKPSESEGSESPEAHPEEEPEASDVQQLVSVYGDKDLQVAKPKPFQFENGDWMYITDATDQAYICRMASRRRLWWFL